MRQFITIASNAFMELVRQPVFLLLMTCSTVFEVFLAVPFYFAFGEELKLVKNTALAVMLLAGLLSAVLCASASLAHEIRSGTALAVLSKPVGRTQFLLAKYAGLVMALALLTYVNMIAALLASRMAFDAYGSTDLFATFTFAGAVIAAYLIGGFSNFFLRRPFVSDAVLSLMLMVTIAFIAISFFSKDLKAQPFAKGVDWRLVPAAVLILFALWILAGLALACSTRLDIIPTLAICSAFFLLGLMSDYLFGRKAAPVWQLNIKEELSSQRWSDSQKALLKQMAAKYGKSWATNTSMEPPKGGTPNLIIAAEDKARLRQAGMGGHWWAEVLYTVTPNWQLFWFGDTLENDKIGFNWNYVAKAFAYVVGYVGATLAIAAVLFGERELG